MDSNYAIGYIGVAVSVVFFGTMALPVKLKRVLDAKADPVVYQVYVSATIFILGWVTLIFAPFRFTYLGIIGAALWVPFSILSIFAIHNLGLGIAQATWSGFTIVTSFIWGAVFFHDTLKSVGLSILALILLIIGLIGFTQCKKKFFIWEVPEPYESVDETQPINPKLAVDEEITQDEPGTFQHKMRGAMFVVVAGFFLGSCMVPFNYLPEDFSAIQYSPNFGIGTAVVTPPVVFLYFALYKREIPKFHFKAISLPACGTGILWSIANTGNIYATRYLGLTIGYPLSNLSLIVAGLVGLFFFKEITHRFAQVQFFISVSVLIGAAALLSSYG